MLAVLAPGQGAQSAGFLTPWLSLPEVAQTVAWASDVVGLDLAAIGTTADDTTLQDTAVAQPLLHAVGIAVARALPVDAEHVGVLAGHSLGELTAAVLAGALTAEAGLVLARERGAAMAAACSGRDGMSALVGTADDIADVVQSRGLTVANRNGSGQVVVAGPVQVLEELEANAPPSVRVRRLRVAGAFHTAAMRPAQDQFAAVAARAPFADPVVPLVSNADGHVVRRGDELRSRLVAQVTAPVRWDQCMSTLRALQVDVVVELAPAGALGAIARRELPEADVVCLRAPDDLASARVALGRDREPAGHVPAWRLAVAPTGGQLHAEAVAEGQHVAAGRVLAHVLSRQSRTPVTAVHAGVLLEWLASDGDPVAPGQPLARLHPDPA